MLPSSFAQLAASGGGISRAVARSVIGSGACMFSEHVQNSCNAASLTAILDFERVQNHEADRRRERRTK
jgi:hypothetical protein